MMLTWYFLVRPLGFEPRTCGLRVRCSAVELEAHRPGRSQDPSSVRALTRPDCSIGVTDGARTRDIQYHKLALYQLNYGHHVGRPVCHIVARVPHIDLQRSANVGRSRWISWSARLMRTKSAWRIE